ncbi:TetR/AcrR family transcriptional regulator [Yinghuangia sp. YIM S10712]|uniref:TetR/AcrR family transcriptional regulator n=1 Tax=Yinghuangia sp. YIM S10712 TaxID=3436930 RepID=UPI003F535B48
MAEAPDVPTPPWRTARKPARAPRKPPITLDAIVDAALAIIDTEGMDALSMRRVAQKLDTGAATLYAHVQSKDELLELLVDRVTGELDLPEPDPECWDRQALAGMRAIRDVYTAHRDLAKASFGRIPTSPKALKASEGMLAILKAGDLPDQVIAWAADLIALYAVSAAYEQGLVALREDQEPGSTQRYFEQVGEFFAALPPERYPALTSLLPAMMAGGSDERYDFGAEVILLGIQAYAERMRAAKAGGAEDVSDSPSREGGSGETAD